MHGPPPRVEGVAVFVALIPEGLLSWSSGCAIWPDSGRVELWAIAGPGASVHAK